MVSGAVISDLVVAAKNRDKANIGLPPTDLASDEDSFAFLIGTEAELNRVTLDRIIHRGPIVDTPHRTEQVLGMIADQFVVKIIVPDLPGFADVVDEIADAAAIVTILGSWWLSRHWTKITRGAILLHIQKARLAKAKQVAAAFKTGQRRRFRATIKTAKIGRSIVKRTAVQTSRLAKARRVSFVATRLGAKVLFKVVGFVGLAIDIVLVSHRVVKGFERKGIIGAEAAFVAGVADVLTLGLAEKQTDILEVKAETFFEQIGQAVKDIGRFRVRF